MKSSAADNNVNLSVGGDRPLSIYERTKIVGIRAEQLVRGAPSFVPVTGAFDPYEVAQNELDSGKLPYMISRVFPDATKRIIRLGSSPVNK